MTCHSKKRPNVLRPCAATLTLLATVAAVSLADHPRRDRTPVAPPPAAVDDLLTRIEKKHDSIKTLEAPLKYDRNQIILGDKQRRFGKLIYVAGPPPKFAIHFDVVVINRRRNLQDRWYVFDGRYLIERLHDRKQFFRRELVAADKVNRKNPLAMGNNPLLVPLPLRKDDILKRYEIAIMAQEPSDPQLTVHLKLKPRHKQTGDDKRDIELWIDEKTLLPVKVRTEDDSQYESIIHLDQSKAAINKPVDEKVIDTSLPTDPGWKIEDIPLESDGATEPSRAKSERRNPADGSAEKDEVTQTN